LQALRQAGLVTTRRDGNRIHYDLAGPDILRLYSLLRSVAQKYVTDVEPKRVAYLGLEGARAKDEEVTREDLIARVRAGTVTVLDVRPDEEYDAAHIPGALSIPLEELRDRLSELPETGEIVAYCRGAYCVLAYEAVEVLRSAGRSASRLNEGMLEWRLRGLPVEAG
jgi:rhodanese-related sulfurtransferase